MIITTSTKQTPQISVVIKASLEEVWRAVRDKKKLSQWHGWETPTLKAEIENIYFTETREINPTGSSQRQLIVNGGDSFIFEVSNQGHITYFNPGIT